MRKIRLINSDGQVCDLTAEPSKYFMHDLSGFGFEMDSEYEQIGNQYLAISRKIEQMMPQGTISMAGYTEYEKFIKFIQREPLVLEYTAADTYLLDVNVKSLEKTELEDMGKLKCPVVFESLGRIYKKIAKRNDVNKNIGKVYPYEYPYAYSDNTFGSVEIESDSCIDSPVTITFIGPVINPAWSHYINGVNCCNGKVFCEIPKGHRLIVSTHGTYRIVEVDAYGKEICDRYQDSDFSTERFVTLSRGLNKISFNHEGDKDINVIVEGLIYYESI